MRARLFGFITRDISVAMMGAGVGMFGYGVSYPRKHAEFTRDRAKSRPRRLTLAPMGAGLAVHGEF